MKRSLLLSFLIVPSLFLTAQTMHKVILDSPKGGTYTVTPSLPQDGMVAEGTVLTVSAQAHKGYIYDGGYTFSLPLMPWGPLYVTNMNSTFKVKIDKETHIGASFLPKSFEKGIKITQDVVYATPGVKPLKYDVYAPKKAKNLPVVIIIHGGGWSSNNEDIMRAMGREMAQTGKVVAFSIDYRWVGKLDGGDEVGVNQIIEDVYGAILHIRENAHKYGASSNEIYVTGDSAGGHLTACVANFVTRIGDGGFGAKENIWQFKPTYMPKGKTYAQVQKELLQSIKAVAPSYGVFTEDLLLSRVKNPEFAKQIAPINFIPNVEEINIPQLLLLGSEDVLIKDKDVKVYVDALVKKGQSVEYTQVGGANHAFFDWKPDAKTQETYAKYGTYYVKQMLAFFLDRNK